MKEYTVAAAGDGDIGTTVNFFFEEREWCIRYVVCDCSDTLGRRVLIPALAFEDKPDNCNKRLTACAGRDTIKNSPQVNPDKPVSRAYQHILDRYYTWHLAPSHEDEESRIFEEPFADSTLHSAREVLGYRLKTKEGEVAVADDFIIDDDDWGIDYIVMQAGLWLPGKRFLLDPHWIDEISWQEKRLFAQIPTEMIRNSPDYDPATVITPEVERQVQEHFGPPRYSARKALEEIIRRKAQELFSRRGARNGDDWADWFEAERQVKEELDRMIRLKAQEICTRRGCKPGNEWHDWFEAERIVQQQLRKRKTHW